MALREMKCWHLNLIPRNKLLQERVHPGDFEYHIM